MGTSRLSASELSGHLSQLPGDLELYSINVDSVSKQFTKWVVVGVSDRGEVLQEFAAYLPFAQTEWIDTTDGDGVRAEALPGVQGDAQEVGDDGSGL